MIVDPRLRVVGVALCGLLLGAVVHAWLRPGPTASQSDDVRERVETLVAEVADLKSALDEERSQRGALELEMALLRRELDAGAAGPQGVGESELATEDTAGRGEGADVALDVERRAAEATRRDWFDAAALRQQGIDERRAEWLHERFEELQMKELYLRDRATREGWIKKPRYFTEAQAVRNEARETLGAEDYDMILYASGRNNRVLIRDVLQNSPAAAAGVEPGDIVLRYDDATILTTSDLTSATSQGKPGSSVAMDLLRDGTLRRVYPPRGPLGVQITGVRRPPSGSP